MNGSAPTSMNAPPADTIASNLLDERQAAIRLGVSVRTLQQWRVIGGGPSFAKIGRCVRYRPCDLTDYVTSNLRAHTSEGGMR